MLTDARSLWYSASNVLQSLNDNITNALETFDQIDEDDEEAKSESEIYKKLLDDAQMQHFELSKQFRVLVAEKDSEIEVWKSKCSELSGGDVSESDVKASIDSAKLEAELSVLKSAISEMEDVLKSSLHEKNELTAKLIKYPELVSEVEELRSRLADTISSSGENDAKKTGEIDDLVAEYSMLAAESEKQKSADSLRIRELELENEVLVTKMHALEHSITELADRSVTTSSTPPSPVKPQNNIPPAPLSGGETAQQVKELRAKIVNLEFDLSEKEEKMQELQMALKKSKEAGDGASSSSDTGVSAEQLRTLQNSLSKRVDEIANLQQDVTRLQVEKQEAEDAGKKFYEQLRALQRESDSERKKSENEASSLEEAQELRRQLENARNEMESIKEESERRIQELLEEGRTDRAAALATVQEEVDSLKADISTLQSEKSTSENKLQQKIEELSSELSEATQELERVKAAHANELDSVKEEVEKAMLSSTDEALKSKIDELTARYEEKQRELSAGHVQALAESAREVERLKNNISELEDKITTLQNQHDSALKECEDRIRAEGVDLASQQVEAAKATALEEKNIALETQKTELEENALGRIKDAIAEQIALHEQAIIDERGRLNEEKAEAMRQQESEMLAATEIRIANMQEAHEKTLSDLKAECDAALAKAVENERKECEKALDDAKKSAEEEKRALETAHKATLETLHQEMATIKNQLDNIEAIHTEKLEAALSELRVAKDAERDAALEALRVEMQTLVDSAYAARDEYLALYTKENKARKAIHNKLMEIQGNIRVICRVRPILEVEHKSGEDVDVTEILSDEDIVIHRDLSTKNRFEFDRVFAPLSRQEEVFEAVQPLVVSVLDGYNVCIFAYGQTGSGKTFTMEGYGTDIGVSPRAISELFRIVQECSEDWSYTITFSTLEIYNESIRDLLDSSGNKDKLDVRQTPEGNVVAGLTEIEVTSPEQVLELMSQGQRNRAVGAHDMNEHSSRSHSILTLTCRGKSLRDGSSTFGKLHMIDLAGSERVGKTDATGDRLKEAQNINRSLSALGDVINSLGSKKATHVPYRNSKLTFLLQDSLGGNSKVLMFVNISPAVYNVGESICSLNFAARCRNVELGQARKQDDGPRSSRKIAAGSASSDSTPVKSSLSSSRRISSTTPSVRK